MAMRGETRISPIFMSAHKAREMLAGRQISAVELTQMVLDRIDEIDPQVSAYLQVTPDLALSQARDADTRLRGIGAGPGPLTGIPMMIKDNISTAGVPTTAGSRMLEGYVPPYDATVVELLQADGAVMVGKATSTSSRWGRRMRIPRSPRYTTPGIQTESLAEAAAARPPRWLLRCVLRPWDRTPAGAYGSPPHYAGWWE